MPFTKEQIEEQLQEYIKTFTPEEQIAYEIAKEQLGSSFDLEKSIGFLDYINSKMND